MELLEYLIGQTWWMVLAGTIYGVCWVTYGDLYKHEPSRKRWIGYLTQNTWSTRYRKLLGNMLDWIDARLTPELADKEKDWQPDEARAAWSHGLLNLSLLLAIIYPILSVIVYWAVTNRDGAIGSLVLVEGDVLPWRRAVAIGLLAGSFLAAILARRAFIQMQGALLIVACGVAFTIALAALAAGAVVVSGVILTVVSAAVIGAIGTGGVATAVAAATAASATIVVAGAGANLGLGAGVAGVAFGGAFGQDWAGRRTGRRILFLTLFAGIMCLSVAATLRFGKPVKPQANGLILFLAVSPLLNAVADFASTGLTRWRLRKGLDGQMWREMLIDLGGAAAAFFLLGALSILAIHHLRWADRSALFDLAEFFTDIRANPGHCWWLYFTLFSTLIPTVLHGAVALFGTGIHLWPGLRRFIVEGLDAGGKGDAVEGRWAVRALCLSMTVSVVAPIVVLGYLATYHGIVGGWVLDRFEGFARLAGAIP